jgi:hypothetical protein
LSILLGDFTNLWEGLEWNKQKLKITAKNQRGIITILKPEVVLIQA